MKNNQKKIIALIMAVTLTGSGFTSVTTGYSKVSAEEGSVSAEEKSASAENIKHINRHDSSGEYIYEEVIDDAKYTVNGDTLYITGSDYVNASSCIEYDCEKEEYFIGPNHVNPDDIKKIDIANGVKILENDCFSRFKNVESISLPNTLEFIGAQAFLGLEFLDDIYIPDSVIEIQSLALSYLPKVKEITIPSSVKYLGYKVISNNDSLKSVTVRGDDLVIPYEFIFNCKNLEEVHFENEVVFTGSNLVVKCDNLKKIIIDRSFHPTGTQIGSYAFTYTIDNIPSDNMCEIELPKDLNKIGKDAFYSFSKKLYFKNINIPQQMDVIESRAFEDATISNLEIKGAKKIGSSAFMNTKGYDYFSIRNVKEIENNAFYMSEIKKLDLTGCPDIKIGSAAFELCNQLESIVLPSSLGECGDNIFSCCPNLKTVEFSSASSIKKLPEGFFSGCTGLSEITLPSKLESISDYAFYNCSGLKQLELPSSLKEIEASAFELSGIETLNIPGSVSTINAILGNSKISSKEKTICSEIILNNGTKEITDGAFKNNIQLKSVTIPESVTTIGDTAFENCPELTIYGVTGSEAEKHANDHNIPFVDINQQEADTSETTVTDAPVIETTVTTSDTTDTSAETTASTTETADTSAETTTAVTTTEKVMYVGDLDHNGVTEITDLTLLSVQLMLNKGTMDITKFPEADIDKNGRIDIADLARMKQYISKDSHVTDLGIVEKK